MRGILCRPRQGDLRSSPPCIRPKGGGRRRRLTPTHQDAAGAPLRGVSNSLCHRPARPRWPAAHAAPKDARFPPAAPQTTGPALRIIIRLLERRGRSSRSRWELPLIRDAGRRTGGQRQDCAALRSPPLSVTPCDAGGDAIGGVTDSGGGIYPEPHGIIAFGIAHDRPVLRTTIHVSEPRRRPHLKREAATPSAAQAGRSR